MPIKTNLHWVEKYRPRSLSGVLGQSAAINALMRLVERSDIQHLLLHGPAGTGKTSTVLALVRQL